jgi:hypothetical protein
MSIKVNVYVPVLEKDQLAQVAARFGELGMSCQFHPAFALDPSRDSGFVLMRLVYDNQDMLSNFEISFREFRYTAPLAMSPTTNEKLKTCTKMVTIRMHATPTSAFRAGMYFAASLAAVADGVLYTPRSDNYFEGDLALQQVKQEVETYESGLSPEDWNVVPFSTWPE